MVEHPVSVKLLFQYMLLSFCFLIPFCPFRVGVDDEVELLPYSNDRNVSVVQLCAIY